MPRLMDALLFEARSHQIDEIPNAGQTQRFGQDESPNACLLCRRSQTASWVKDKVLSWGNRNVRSAGAWRRGEKVSRFVMTQSSSSQMLDSTFRCSSPIPRERDRNSESSHQRHIDFQLFAWAPL